jgi:hypothetical protein
MLNYELFHLLAYTILSTVMALISTNLAWNRQNRDNGPLKDLLFDIIPDISYISIPCRTRIREYESGPVHKQNANGKRWQFLAI